MKAIAQALTFKDIAVIRGALLDDIARTDLPIDTEPMKEALKKVDGVIDDMRYQQCNNTYFLIIPVVLEEIIKEQQHMELDRFDLKIIQRALALLMQVSNPIDEETLQNTESAIEDILTEYPNASVFEVKPNMLEE